MTMLTRLTESKSTYYIQTEFPNCCLHLITVFFYLCNFKTYCTHPSLVLLLLLLISQGRGGSSLSKEAQLGDNISPVGPGSFSGPPPGGTIPKNLYIITHQLLLFSIPFYLIPCFVYLKSLIHQMMNG